MHFSVFSAVMPMQCPLPAAMFVSDYVDCDDDADEVDVVSC